MVRQINFFLIFGKNLLNSRLFINLKSIIFISEDNLKLSIFNFLSKENENLFFESKLISTKFIFGK